MNLSPDLSSLGYKMLKINNVKQSCSRYTENQSEMAGFFYA